MSNMPDLSSLLGMINNKNPDIGNLLQNLSNNDSKNNSSNTDQTPTLDDILNNKSSNDSSSSNQNSNNDFQMPDMDTIMKIMKLMNSIKENDNNPSTNLLFSLKPFLRDSKKEKVDQYIKFLKISSVLNEINKSGGDFK